MFSMLFFSTKEIFAPLPKQCSFATFKYGRPNSLPYKIVIDGRIYLYFRHVTLVE
jgi:hypothetical protein